MSDLRYPVGRFAYAPHAEPESAGAAERRAVWIEEIAELPAHLRDFVHDLDASQLATPYRPEGWTVRQLVHHVADSHINAYVRLKLALTQDDVTIQPYDEGRWAELPDVALVPVEASLQLLDALHARWAALLRAMPAADFARRLHHPERPTPMTVEQLTALYAWHGRHHVAHVTALREREGWG